MVRHHSPSAVSHWSCSTPLGTMFGSMLGTPGNCTKTPPCSNLSCRTKHHAEELRNLPTRGEQMLCMCSRQKNIAKQKLQALRHVTTCRGRQCVQDWYLRVRVGGGALKHGGAVAAGQLATLPARQELRHARHFGCELIQLLLIHLSQRNPARARL